MSIDKSLKRKTGGITNRSVLTRAERISTLKEADKWVDGRSPFGLPKVRVLKISLKKVKKDKEEEDPKAKAPGKKK